MMTGWLLTMAGKGGTLSWMSVSCQSCSRCPCSSWWTTASHQVRMQDRVRACRLMVDCLIACSLRLFVRECLQASCRADAKGGIWVCVGWNVALMALWPCNWCVLGLCGAQTNMAATGEGAGSRPACSIDSTWYSTSAAASYWCYLVVTTSWFERLWWVHGMQVKVTSASCAICWRPWVCQKQLDVRSGLFSLAAA